MGKVMAVGKNKGLSKGGKKGAKKKIKHRRKGVAKKLMQRVLQEAQERDVHNIISYVRNDNKAAIHINQKFGFGITSNDKRDPSLFVMEKMLHINNPAPASA